MGIGENPDGRRRREFGEASSSENERKAGLGPYLCAPGLLWGGDAWLGLAFRDLEEQRKEKKRPKYNSTGLHCTGLLSSLPVTIPTNLSIVA